MAERIHLHPVAPKPKQIFVLADHLADGSVLMIPTDSQYALVCDYQNKKGIDRIRSIRRMDKKDHLTVMCHSLEHASVFAVLNDTAFKLVRRLIPGPYTFILPATREVPRLLMHPKKRTVGIRVPDDAVCLGMTEALGRPVLAITAKLPDVQYGSPDSPDREMYLSRFDRLVDLIADTEQPLQAMETTMLDLTGNVPVLMREGLGMEKLTEALALEGLDLA